MNRLHPSVPIFSFVVLYSTFTLPVIGATLTPGSVDFTFDPGAGAEGGTVLTVTTDSLGRVLIAGDFTSVDGVDRSCIARLNGDGSLDTTFDPGTGVANEFSEFGWHDEVVYSVTTDSNDRVIIGGAFISVDGVPRSGIARLSSDGSLDTTFVANANQDEFTATVYSIATDLSDRVIIVGSFNSVNGVARNGIARLTSNGSLDTSFANVDFDRAGPSSVAIDSAGRVIVGGSFETVNGVTRNGVARLNSNGSLDTTFNPGGGVRAHESDAIPSAIYSVTTDWNDRVIIGGFFGNVNGIPRNCIAKLNVNGSVYSEFDPGSGTNDYVNSVAVDTSGRVIIAGEFTTVDEIPRNGIARLKRNGEVDETFNPGTGASNSARVVAVDIGGQVIIGGGFTSMNGVDRNRIARLHGGESDATPGINITFDYRYDTNGFFAGSNIHRRIVLEAAAQVFEDRLMDRLTAIVPNDVNPSLPDSWRTNCIHPGNGSDLVIDDLTVPANTILIFPGARSVDGAGNFIAKATSGDYLVDAFTIGSRGGGPMFGAGATDYAIWGGSIFFDTSESWHTILDALVPPGNYDLFTVSVHEIAHILGINSQSDSWDNLNVDLPFNPLDPFNTDDRYIGGRGNLVSSNIYTKGGHFADDTFGKVEYTGVVQRALMTDFTDPGVRRYFTDVDFAALDDLGWEVLWPTKPDTSATRQAIQNLITATIRRIDAAKKANNKRVLKAQKRKLKALKIQMATL